MKTDKMFVWLRILAYWLVIERMLDFFRFMPGLSWSFGAVLEENGMESWK